MANVSSFYIKRSISFKFNGALAVLLALILLGMGIVISFLYTMSLIESTNRNIHGQATKMTQELGPALDKKIAETELRSILSGLSYLNDILCLDLLDEEGGKVLDWERDPLHPHCNTHLIIDEDQTKFSNLVLFTRHDFSSPNKRQYTLYIATDARPAIDNMLQYFVMGFIFIIVFILVFYIWIWIVINRVIIRPIKKIHHACARILETHDYNQTIPSRTNDEIGQLASVLNANNQWHIAMMQQISACCEVLSNITVKLGDSSKDLSEHTSGITANSNKTITDMKELLASFDKVSTQLNSLNTLSLSGFDNVNTMTDINQQMASSLTAMHDAVDNSINSIDGMSGYIQQNATIIEALNSEVAAVYSAMQRLTSFISREERSANSSLALAQQLSVDAQNGYKSLQKTLEGIGRIKESSEQVSAMISQLGHDILGISGFLSVIEDITNQTNLLALNAAITAAQAGEHGRSFSVVSDEIATLANRTKESTKEIAMLIEVIQKSVKKATQAMQKDSFTIEEGALLGNTTAQVFGTLQESANLTAEQAQQIARATLDQANEVRIVNESIKNIATKVDAINQASHNQANQAAAMTIVNNNMQLLNTQIARASADQLQASEAVHQDIQNFSVMADKTNKDQQDQASQTHHILAIARDIGNSAERQSIITGQLDLIITAINQQIAILQNLSNKQL